MVQLSIERENMNERDRRHRHEIMKDIERSRIRRRGHIQPPPVIITERITDGEVIEIMTTVIPDVLHITTSRTDDKPNL